MPIQKLRPAFTFDQDRIEQLKTLVPEAFADGKINWDVLKEALGEHLEDEAESAEHFGLFWPGKREARRFASKPSSETLIPSLGEGVDEDGTRNIFIEGDNLEVMKLLQKSYAGRIRMMFIDPPYNTGNDLIYHDDFKESRQGFLGKTEQADKEGALLTTNSRSDGRFHTNWLNMIYPRLRVARSLLSEDGVIFVSIDNNEVHNLRALMNEIFGEENFITCIANVNNPKGRSDDKYVATAHEYVVVYKKSAEVKFGGWEPEENILRRYNKVDSKGQKYREIDLRKTGDNDRRKDRENLFYYFLFNPDTKDFYPTRDEKTPRGFVQIRPLREDGTEGNWRWEPTTAQERIQRLVPKLMPVRKTWSVFEMDYLTPEERIKPTSAWMMKDVNSERGSEQFIDLGFKKEVFPRPKPVGLLKLILQLATKPGDSDIVLDFFAGSATTGHAVFEQNTDGGNRRFILIQVSEAIDPNAEAYKEGFKTIAEIGKERIRRVSKKLKTDGATGDLGFRVYKLAASNFKPWQDYDGQDVAALEQQFTQFETPLVDGWTKENLLSEIILQQGFPLDSTITPEKECKENEVIVVSSPASAHKLIVCVDEHVQDATVNQLKLGKRDVFVCLDSALKSEAKVRLGDAINLVVI